MYSINSTSRPSGSRQLEGVGLPGSPEVRGRGALGVHAGVNERLDVGRGCVAVTEREIGHRTRAVFSHEAYRAGPAIGADGGVLAIAESEASRCRVFDIEVGRRQQHPARLRGSELDLNHRASEFAEVERSKVSRHASREERIGAGNLPRRFAFHREMMGNDSLELFLKV